MWSTRLSTIILVQPVSTMQLVLNSAELAVAAMRRSENVLVQRVWRRRVHSVDVVIIPLLFHEKNSTLRLSAKRTTDKQTWLAHINEGSRLAQVRMKTSRRQD